MTTSFDPDDTTIPVFDDRPERIVRVVDPVIRKRNKNNRQRGRKAEKAWAALIAKLMRDLEKEAEFPAPETRGVLGGADVIWGSFSFEVKHHGDRSLRPAEVKAAWEQAKQHAQGRFPVVVCCRTPQGKSRAWEIYLLDESGPGDGEGWLRWVLT